ncbi:acyltransferase domain-containing protein [Nocardia sp. NPDC101769]|uniref:acyltransferase domain-containing protein n=1 Tax=Nocardia sp. NPDC101769 TaxID=3364333 RepID=UPI00381F2A98
MSIVGVGCRSTGLEFDHEWFGIDRLEAAGLTPRQRTNLEVAVEALDDSGLGCLAPASNAAVVFGAVGGTNSAHHLSRALDLRGPSLTVDSRRASPLVAVDMGVRLLADEAVPFVIAGGVDLALLPDISDLRIPVPRNLGSGVATGAGGGNGICTVLVLQRTTDALRSRTRRYADIGGPAIGFPEADSPDAHIALDDPARPGGPPALDRGDEPPVLLPLTGRDPAAIHALALRWAVAIGSYRSLREFASATARLIPEPTRAAVLARDTADAAAQLRTLARRIAITPVSAHTTGTVTAVPLPRATTGIFDPVRTDHDGGTLFLFPGTGGHPRMGRALAARYPVFAAALTAAVDAVAAAGGPRVWTPRNGFHRTTPATRPSAGPPEAGCGRAPSAGSAVPASGRLVEAPRRGGDHGPDHAREFGCESDTSGESGAGDIVFEHSALFAFQVALAELLESVGLHADAVAGHGVGEVAAAVACGALSLDDGARVVVARARLLERAGEGAAAAVLEATLAEVTRLVEPMRADVAVATVDGPTAITVAGEPRYIDALVRRAHRRAIFAQRLPADAMPAAAHLPAIRDRAAELHDELTDLAALPPQLPFYSTTRPRPMPLLPDTRAPEDETTRTTAPPATDDLRTDAAYWAANAWHPVHLAAALESAAADGISRILEIGPQPVPTTGWRERTPYPEGAQAVLARDGEAESFLHTVARGYLDGRAVDWTALGSLTAPPPQRQWRRSDSGVRRRWGDDGFGAAYPVGPPPAPAFPAVEIRPDGTYVVAGGLGPQGEVAVRWLLEAGARDVVVLTRTPRPLPPGLTGMEERIVVMRCDCADRTDLATALQDIRECGSAVRGVVHASGETRLVAAANLLELTTADATDFTVLLTCVPSAAEPGAVRKLAAAQVDRRVICVEWEVGPAA